MAEEQRRGSAAQPVEQALTFGEPQRVGWFRFYFADEQWEWSPQIERMHGYRPGSIRPTTELVLSHKHPDDYQEVAAELDDIRRTAGVFSTRHRIVDTQGEIHHIVVVGDRLFDDDGTVIGTHGFYVDVTPSVRQYHDRYVTAAVAEITAATGAIEQAKGMLMLIYRINTDAATELLQWRAQQTDVELRVLAEQIVTDFRSLDYGAVLPSRAVYDRLLLTAHQRVR